METRSFWSESPIPRQSTLAGDRSFDVVVVGGGITGLTTAYLLQLAGFSGCVLERNRLGSGDTGCTTAHLTYVTDLRLSDLVQRFGRESARLLWTGGAAAIETIESLVDAEMIECDFRRVPGFLHLPFERDSSAGETAGDDRRLDQDFEAARELGFAAHWLDSIPVMQVPGVRFANQGQIHPAKYLAGLARAVTSGGWQIYEDAEVAATHEDGTAVKVGAHYVNYRRLVLATHVPLAGETGLVSAAMFQAKLAPYSTYVVQAGLANSSFPAASFWDTADPYNYLRIEPAAGGRQVLIYGGEDHKTGQEEDTPGRFKRLERRLQRLFPAARIEHRWSGQVIETHDGLPYIGQTAERQFVATGFAGNGLTFGTLGAMLICDRILGNDNPWADLFDVNRPPLRGGIWNYLTENFDYPYYLLKDRFGASAAGGEPELLPGEGRVVRQDGRWVARSVNAAGERCDVSAVCTHLGCLVRWNRAEQTWDCPCHGSRFAADGKLRSGPAEEPLERVDRGAAHEMHASRQER